MQRSGILVISYPLTMAIRIQSRGKGFLFRELLAIMIIMILFSILFIPKAMSQTIDYTKDPVWIKMIDDPAVNYYEALKAYSEYWKYHVKPAGEEEEMAEGEKDSKEREREVRREVRKDKKKVFTEEDRKKQNENVVMKYQVKRFEQWAREMKPFVQEDGRILSDKERMEIWNRQQEEINKQK